MTKIIAIILLSLIVQISWVSGELIKPEDGSELSYIHVLFRWDAEADVTDYTFELSSSSDFTSILLNANTTDTKYFDKENINWQSTYYWRVKPADGEFSAASSFTTSSPSYQFSGNVNPVEIITNNSELTFDGITVYGIMNPFYSAAIDMDGNEVWNSGGVDSYMFSYVDNNHFFLGNANLPPNYKGELGVEFDIEQGVIWSQPTYGDEADFLQHELIKLPNGHYMGFVIIDSLHFVPNSDDFSQIPNTYDFPFEDDISTLWDGTFAYPWIWKGERIVEWDEYGNEIWSWNVFEYFNLNDFDYISGFWENAASSGDPFDWTHFNALAYDENENMVYVSSKNLSRITKIDRETGEIIWNIGKQWLGDDVIVPDNLFSGQHGLQLLDNGNVLDKDNLVFFDNGILSGKFDGTNIYKSTAVELRVDKNIDGEYSAETVWSYTLPAELYGVISGNVQKLSNGNYLITTVGSNDGAHSLEVTQSGETVWDCKYNVGTPQGAIYRAMRIPSLYFDISDDASGCTNPQACNYDELANEDDGSCSYLDCNGTCGGPVVKDVCGICDGGETDTNNCQMSIHYDITKANQFQIQHLYPNPFNPIINIEYEISIPASIQFEIYTIKGKLIDRISEGYKFPGIYSAVWNGKNYPSGMYFVTLESESTSLTKKMILLK